MIFLIFTRLVALASSLPYTKCILRSCILGHKSRATASSSASPLPARSIVSLYMFFIRKYFIRKLYSICQKVKKVQYWILHTSESLKKFLTNKAKQGNVLVNCDQLDLLGKSLNKSSHMHIITIIISTEISKLHRKFHSWDH